jgi:hypothetical protein
MINIEAIKSRLASFNNKGNSNSKVKEFVWKPEEGKQNIRIVPYQFQPDNPFIELKFHYDFEKKTYLSPASFNKADPIVELSDRLKHAGDKDSWRIGRDLEPKMRTFVPIIVRGKEAEGVKFWGFGVQVYKQLMAAMSEPDYGDITDLMNGYDIKVEFTKNTGKKSQDGKQAFPETTIMVLPKQKPVIDPTMSNAKGVLELITTKQPNILEVYTVATYEELATALEAHLKKNSKGQAAAAAEDDDNVRVPTDAEIEKAVGPVATPTPAKEVVLDGTPGPKAEVKADAPVASPSAAKAGGNTAEYNRVFEELFKKTT